MATYKIEVNYGYTIKGKDADLYDTELADGFTVNDYMLNVMKRGWTVSNGNETTMAEVEELSVAELYMIMNLEGGSVSNFKPYIKIAEDLIDDEITIAIPNVTYTTSTYDEDTEETTTTTTTNTWSSWIGSNYTKSLVDGYYYFLSNAGTTKGVAMSGTELMLIYNSDDATLVDSIPEESDDE